MTKNEIIKAIRQKSGLTQKAFAEENALTYISVRSWEQGLRNPRFETVIALAKKYDFDLDL